MTRLRALAVTTLIAASAAAPARAQVLSPGKLSSAHAELEGLRQCTSCHQLGTRGVQASLCLECHTTVAARIDAGRGLHADAGTACAKCHQEHLGRDFALVRLDTAAVDHERLGFRLTGAHADASCRDCHAGEFVAAPDVRRYASTHDVLDRTFLGLSTDCAGCHRAEDPHGAQFRGHACADCHDTRAWTSAPLFSHAETRYRLTGRHAQVECAACHARGPAAAAATTSAVTALSAAATSAAARMLFRPLEFGACTACHADPHRGAMQGRCESCHGTADWLRIDRGTLESRFDHATTRFDLVGRHGELACASCHDARTIGGLEGIHIAFAAGTARRPYPRPQGSTCVACHVDAHEGALGRAVDCAACHGETSWLPAAYDLERHDRDSGFTLAGAHRAVACGDCHRTEREPFAFHPPSGTCTDCHAADDPHRGQFASRACTECHGQESFRLERFDHARTRYPLDGSHRSVPCASCHATERTPEGAAFVRYRPLGTACRDCHEGVR